MQKKNSRTVWFDWDNSPHVPFFMPILRRFEEIGYAVEVTVRDCFQVCGLADLYKVKYKRIGRHYGKNRALKVFGNLFRAMQLLPIAAKTKPVVALSHGSRAMIVAARLLNIPTAVMMDYEFVQMIPFMNLALIIAPEVVAMNGVARGKTTVAKYPGIKEDVYVPFFKPDGMIKKDLGLEEDKIVVTIRPPATEAHYHNAESEILFTEVMNMLGALDNVQIVILPRNEVKQTAWIKANWPAVFPQGKAFIPSKVVDGLNLIWHSDLVISGGGTMNREAAALGVPVYSIFRGKIGAVDRYLSQSGRLQLLTSKEEVRRIIKVQQRDRAKETGKAQSEALDAIVNAVVRLIEKSNS